MAEGFKKFRGVIREAFSYLFPSFCILCDMPVEAEYPFRLCKRCRKELFFLREEDIASVSNGLEFVDCYASVFLYAGVFKKLLWMYKEQGRREIANLFCEHVYNRIQELGVCAPVVPVPSHRQRIKKRGFCHTSLIARKLNRSLGFVETVRVVYSDKGKVFCSQKNLGREERRLAVKGRYAVGLKKHVPDCVIVFDDVCTTGATLDECARVLKDCGVSKVFAISIAAEP